MRKTMMLMGFLAVVGTAPAAAPAKPPLDPEVEANDKRLLPLLLDAKATYDGQIARQSNPSRLKFYHKPKDFKKIAADLGEIERLAKDGKTTVATVFDVKRVRAKVYADPLDLSCYDEAVSAYDALVAAAPTDKDRLDARFERATYLLNARQVEASVPQRELDEVFAALPEPERLKRMTEFPGHDYDGPEGRALAEKVGESGLADWYRSQVQIHHLIREDALDVRNSYDYKIALCDEAIAKLPKRSDEFVRLKCALLMKMHDFVSAERICRERLEQAPADDPGVRCECLNDLATLYVARAARYYSDPDEKLIRQAVAFWDEAVKVFTAPENAKRRKATGRFNVTELFRQPIRQAILICDYKLAAAWLDRYAQFLGEKAAKDPWICGCRGDLAYYAGDYAAAVKWYETPEKGFADAPSRRAYPNSHYRYMGALNALGEYEKCLKALEKCPAPYRSEWIQINAVGKAAVEARLKAAEKQSAK